MILGDIMFYKIPFLVILGLSLVSAKEVIQPITQDIPQIGNPSTSVENELSMLNNLIDVTKENLSLLEQCKKHVIDYISLQEKYAQNTENEKLTFQMVMSADQLLEEIKELHLTQAFDQEFLSELTFFSKVASKWKNDK